MAGDWIKMRHALPSDPAVLALSHLLSIHIDTVIGKLHRFWCWVSDNTGDGRIPGVTAEALDRLIECQGFAGAMVTVKWLRVTRKGLVIPNFENHNSAPAKARAGEMFRKRLQREDLPRKGCPDIVRTRAEAAESRKENREQKSRGRQAPPGSGRDGPPPFQHLPAQGDRQEEEICRVLSEMTHGGGRLFQPKAAAAIAKHARASKAQVAWAIECYTERKKTEQIGNPAGYLRSLIEQEQAPREWVARFNKQQLALVVDREQRLAAALPPRPLSFPAGPSPSEPASREASA